MPKITVSQARNANFERCQRQEGRKSLRARRKTNNRRRAVIRSVIDKVGQAVPGERDT
ncbi:hypothetical protein [Blastopirellula marina]|uniref:hypothetical protein n=1 Tax=Blastopirellula marina TaxID=124 RepID=UPI001304F0C1|nr:hypothetical protein [Blastopirellula marina]